MSKDLKPETIRARIERAFEIERESAIEAGTVGFMARAMVQATMPHKKTAETYYVRENGSYRLTMQAAPDVGLPYGSIPRLLLAWISTEVVRTKERELILGDSLSEFMSKLGLVPTGGRWGSITRLKDQSNRLFDCSIRAKRTSQVETPYDIKQSKQNERFFIADSDTEGLWSLSPNPDQKSLFASTVRLSERFYDEIIDHPVPIDLRVLKELSKSPLMLDVYAWIVYRIYTLNRSSKPSVVIPWEVLQLQFGSSYPADTAQGRADFKRKFLQALSEVHLHYPQAKIADSKGGLMMKKSPQHIPSRALKPL